MSTIGQGSTPPPMDPFGFGLPAPGANQTSLGSITDPSQLLFQKSGDSGGAQATQASQDTLNDVSVDIRRLFGETYDTNVETGKGVAPPPAPFSPRYQVLEGKSAVETISNSGTTGIGNPWFDAPQVKMLLSLLNAAVKQMMISFGEGQNVIKSMAQTTTLAEALADLEIQIGKLEKEKTLNQAYAAIAQAVVCFASAFASVGTQLYGANKYKNPEKPGTGTPEAGTGPSAKTDDAFAPGANFKENKAFEPPKTTPPPGPTMDKDLPPPPESMGPPPEPPKAQSSATSNAAKQNEDTAYNKAKAEVDKQRSDLFNQVHSSTGYMAIQGMGKIAEAVVAFLNAPIEQQISILKAMQQRLQGYEKINQTSQSSSIEAKNSAEKMIDSLMQTFNQIASSIYKQGINPGNNQV